MNKVVVNVSDISKSFILNTDRAFTFKERVLRRGGKGRVFTALSNVSFQVTKGESVAIIGRNGAGKSTLLKLLNKIIYPTNGVIQTHGRIAGLLELGAGFHPDFTGRENIFVNASILGFNKREVESRIDEIIDFAEIREFIDAPTRTYSSGMYMRLAFSVAIMVEPDIFLIDEVLSVGDVSFQEKCMKRLRHLKDKGVTIIMISHSEGQVREICNRAIWIDEHRLKMDGDVDTVYSAYNMEMSGARHA
ncbi:ABC transporter ATP-binding protein [Alicyclobacillus suci]|uniref:ABC transporter ATP-binding protein n=1 Tax=Alicyclobacillus suci TaxID=2816080 RepID=UPI001A8F3894|nr:ABC transporter ATP-binding protein [Alicyclobacillus suci]